MKRIMRISGCNHEVVTFIHRRYATDSWAIRLPGLEIEFADAEHGGTAAALQCAKDRLPEVLELNIYALRPHCALVVDVRMHRCEYEALVSIPSAYMALRVAALCGVADEVLAGECYDKGLVLPLISTAAQTLLGQETQARLIADWVRAMKTHITATNIVQKPVGRSQPTVHRTRPAAKAVSQNAQACLW